MLLGGPVCPQSADGIFGALDRPPLKVANPPRPGAPHCASPSAAMNVLTGRSHREVGVFSHASRRSTLDRVSTARSRAELLGNTWRGISDSNE